jgi:hypothetical protein
VRQSVVEGAWGNREAGQGTSRTVVSQRIRRPSASKDTARSPVSMPVTPITGLPCPSRMNTGVSVSACRFQPTTELSYLPRTRRRPAGEGHGEGEDEMRQRRREPRREKDMHDGESQQGERPYPPASRVATPSYDRHSTPARWPRRRPLLLSECRSQTMTRPSMPPVANSTNGSY